MKRKRNAKKAKEISCSRDWNHLPEGIIHRIHYLLHQKDDLESDKTVIRTSLISKAWRLASSTSSTLSIKESHFPNHRYKKLRKYVDRILLRYGRRKIGIKSFRFHCSSLECHSQLNNWLDLARKNGVEEIYLSAPPARRVLPQTAFDIKTLKTLSLCNCNLLDIWTIKCQSLKNLSLKLIHTDEKTINSFLSSCPSLETLVVNMCSGFAKIHVAHLFGIRVFDFSACVGRTFGLDIFEDGGSSSKERTSVCRNIHHAFKYLTCLKLSSVCITDMDFDAFSSRFPFLDHLFLGYCDSLERINVKFERLIKLTIRWCQKIKVANIDSPKLRILGYKGGDLQELKFSNRTLRQMEYADLDLYGRSDASWFLSLRENLQRFRQSKVKISYIVKKMNEDSDIENLRFMASPLEENVRKLSLAMYRSVVAPQGSINIDALLSITIDALFSICRPRYFLEDLRVGIDTSNKKRCKFLLEKLAERENPSCCSSYSIKCWRHYLKDVKIRRWRKEEFDEHSEENDEDGWRLIGDDWKSFVAMDGLVDWHEVHNLVIRLDWISPS